MDPIQHSLARNTVLSSHLMRNLVFPLLSNRNSISLGNTSATMRAYDENLRTSRLRRLRTSRLRRLLKRSVRSLIRLGMRVGNGIGLPYPFNVSLTRSRYGRYNNPRYTVWGHHDPSLDAVFGFCDRRTFRFYHEKVIRSRFSEDETVDDVVDWIVTLFPDHFA